MIIILQRYILKELLKACVLTAIALTCMVGFGGSLVNLLRTSDISASKLIKLLAYLLPIAFAYSLPVATLFGTTITYGRLSASNEIDACKASGINIYKLFLPVILLSIVVFIISFIFENFTIPELTHRAELLVSKNVQSILYSRLKTNGYATYMNYALHCDRIEAIEEPTIKSDGVSEGQVFLSGVAFLKHKDNIPIFYGTAKTALVLFKTENQKQTIHISLNQVVAFNEKRGEVIEAEYYPLGPFKLQAGFFKKRIKFLSLPVLLQIYSDPMKYEPLSQQINSLYYTLEVSLIYNHLYQTLNRNSELILNDGKNKYTIHAETVNQDEYDGKLILGKVEISSQTDDKISRIFRAKQATILARKVYDQIPAFIDIHLQNAEIKDIKEDNTVRTVRHSSFVIQSLLSPTNLTDEVRKINPLTLIDIKNTKYNYNSHLSAKRSSVNWYWKRVINRTTAEINTRVVYSLSALVLLILGAGLGIIFKGGHFISAFGLSFIPIGIIIIMILSGRQLCISGYLISGIFVIWSGLLITAISAIVVLGIYLRR